jgi:hypothetical protein
MKLLVAILIIFFVGMLVLLGLAGQSGAFELLIGAFILLFLIAIGNLYFSRSPTKTHETVEIINSDSSELD